MLQYSRMAKHIYLLLLVVFANSNIVAQHLSLGTSSGEAYQCPLSIRPVVSGYLPAHTNLIGDNYQFHDIRPLTWICDPADSILSSSDEPLLLISDKWPCRYTPRKMEHGALVLITVDSNELHTAGISTFENNSDQFGPAYVIATSKQCIRDISQEINSIESIVFEPENLPIYSNFSNIPTYHVSDDISLRLPCLQDNPFTLAITVNPEENLEIRLSNEGPTVLSLDWLTLGRSWIDRRSKRYSPKEISNELIYNVSAGTFGDLVQISPRCEGVDSFSAHIIMQSVNSLDTCLIYTEYPFAISKQLDTLTAEQSGDRYVLRIPISNSSISFLSDQDELKELPDRDPQGDHKSYYIYDDFEFNLAIGSEGACNQLNFDLNDGQVSYISRIPSKAVPKFETCQFVLSHSSYSCSTHPEGETILASDYYSLEKALPSFLDVVFCKTGEQSSLVPARQF